MNLIRTYTILSLLFLFLIANGCGKQKLPEGIPPLYPISVTIMQDKKPLPGAIISISPSEGDVKWGAVGTTDEKGVAKKFFTSGQYEGVVAGKFKVTVRKVEREREEIDIPPEPTDLQEKYAWRMKYIENQPPPKEYDLVDKKLQNFKTTTLELDVQPAKRGNDFTLDVGNSVRILGKR